MIGEVVNEALKAFPAEVQIVAEPGRYLVSDAGYFVCRVIGTTTRAGKRWMHWDAGLFGGVIVSLFQVYTFLLVAYFCGVELPPWGYLTVLPALILAGMMFGALGMLLSSTIKQLENFAGIMNFVIFPMFFASSALYPLWKMKEGSLWLYYVCLYNPFTWAVELIRSAFYLEVNWQALGIVVGCTTLFLALSFWAYDPAVGIQQRKAAAPAAAG